MSIRFGDVLERVELKEQDVQATAMVIAADSRKPLRIPKPAINKPPMGAQTTRGL